MYFPKDQYSKINFFFLQIMKLKQGLIMSNAPLKQI